MKPFKLITLITVILFNSCVTNYYTYYNVEDIQLYSKKRDNNYITIPKGSEISIPIKNYKSNYINIKWKRNSGVAYKPNVLTPDKYLKYKQDSIEKSIITINNKLDTIKKTHTSNEYKPTNSNGSVYVKGYYRKDGTYVKPHTRSSPKRR